VPVHVTETVTADEAGGGGHRTVRAGSARPAGDDLPPRELFRPGHASNSPERAESLRVTDAEVLDGREVYVIYRPGRGLEARDAVG
jgi:hypothetical protein